MKLKFDLYKDLKKTILVPVIIILISIFFIQYLRYGVEFNGGLEIKLKLNHSINSQDLSFLSSKYEIQRIGNYYLIRTEMDKDLLYIYSQLREYDKLTEEIENLKIKLSFNSSNRNIKEQLKKKEDQLNKTLNILFLSLGVKSHFREAYEKRLREKVNEIILEFKKYGVISYDYKIISPSLSKFFVSTVIKIIVVSLILSSFFIFLIFRSLIPSIAVILGALFDITSTLGFMGIFGIPISLGSISALLMILGYSLDTDVLLTIRAVKRKENTLKERIYNAMKTGITMSITTFLAFLVLTLIGLLGGISLYYHIGSVVIIGLLLDIIGTWFMNAVILIKYVGGRNEV